MDDTTLRQIQVLTERALTVVHEIFTVHYKDPKAARFHASRVFGMLDKTVGLLDKEETQLTLLNDRKEGI